MDDLMGDMGFTDAQTRRAQNDGRDSDRPLALVVLGMHRSGTSALARVLSLSGLSLPETLMTPGQDNPEGFWESERISDFNDKLLKLKGTQWDDPFSYSPEPRGQALLRPHLNEAIDLLQQEFPRDLPIVFKDPRLSLLASFWHEALERAGYAPHYVIGLRHPTEIARSLAKRNQFAHEKSYLLWLSYMLSIERDTRLQRRCFVSYDDLLADWSSLLDSIEDSLKIRFDRRDPSAQFAIEGALKTGLRHHHATEKSRQSKSIPIWVKHVFDALSQPAFEAFDDADPQLKKVLASYSQQRAFFGPILTGMQQETERLAETSSEALAALERKLQKSSDAYEAEIASRAQELAAERKVIVQLTTEKEDQASKIAHLQVDLSDRNEALRRKSDALAQSIETAQQLTAEKDTLQEITEQYESNAQHAQSVIQSLETELKHEQDVSRERHNLNAQNATIIDDLRAELGDRNDALRQHKDALLVALSERDDSVEAHNHTLEERDSILAERSQLEAKTDELEADAQHAQSVIQSLESELKREQTMSLERHRLLARISAELNEIRSSTTWRATKIARQIGAKLPRPTRRTNNQTPTQQVDTVTAKTAGLTNTSPDEESHRRLPTPSAPSLVRSPAATSSVKNDAPGIPADTSAVADWTRFDPNPIAEFLVRRDENEAGARRFNDHCEQFPLPYSADQQDKPELTLSDAQAEAWIARLKSLANGVPDAGHTPDVTLILPVYNQLAFTISALASVYTQNTRRRIEIILGDDASTDQTAWLGTAGIKNLRVARTPGNLGFLGNVNNAAQLARGRNLVLLNNDTIALNGWLDSLIDTLESDASIGMVGSQLIFPTGRLQEAGGIVWRDGSAWNYGRNEDPQDPRYAFARDVDYCSGASIALSKTLWDDLAGFDGETFKKAYYEDTDLAFRVREAGYRVRYQPRSALVHFEGASSGMDLNSGQKQYQVENEKRFLKRWQRTLSGHRVNADNPVAEANRTLKKQILIIDAVTPTPDKDAGSLVTVEMILALQANGYQVSFIPEDNFAYLSDCSPQLLAAGVQIYHWPFYKTVDEVLEFEGHRFDAVLIFRVTCASKHMATIKRRAPHAKVFFHVADLHHLREAREAEIKGDAQLAQTARKTEKLELQAVRDADLTIVHSEAEEAVLARKVPGKAVYTFPWIAEPQFSTAALTTARTNVMFVGGFRHNPNVQGLSWFSEEVWPRIRRERPDLTLTVIGAEAPDEIMALDGHNGIEIVGWVPDLDPYFAKARLSVAPLLYGAGVKGKVISSFSAGVPVVGTTIALEGLSEKAVGAALIADAEDDFAAAVLSLLNTDSVWLDKAQAGIDFVANELSRRRGISRIVDMEKLVGLC